MTVFAKLAAALLVTVASTSLAAATEAKLRVVSSFSIISDFAQNIGGDRIELTTLVGPNGDAHVYEPSPNDAAAVGKAQLVLVNGLHFEGFLERLVDASGTKAQMVEVSKGAEILKSADEAQGHEHKEEAHTEADDAHAHETHAAEADGHQHGDLDPHAWQSIPNARVYVENIAQAFCAADQSGCDAYKANAAAYAQKLTALDEEVRATVASIPAEKRTIITSHDAFGYFAHEYGLTFLAPEGVSTDAEASAADVAALIRQIREDKASAIFVENITNARLIEQVAAETGLSVGGALYSDALSDATGPAATYIDMMRHNASTIKGAINGS